MIKLPDKYYQVCEWEVIEKDFNPQRARISESVFCLANEFCGIRGYFEEGYSADHLLGSYFNCQYENMDIPHDQLFKGVVTRGNFMPNSVDWLYTRIFIDDEQLDLARSKFSDFTRVLDLKSGILTREYIWHTRSGKDIKVAFERFLNMHQLNMGCQKITVESLNFSGEITVRSGMDFGILHEIAEGWSQIERKDDAYVPRGKCLWEVIKTGTVDELFAIEAHTLDSKIPHVSCCKVAAENENGRLPFTEDRAFGIEVKLSLTQNKPASVEKLAVNHWEEKATPESVWNNGLKLAEQCNTTSYAAERKKHLAWWEKTWNIIDIKIEGDPELQQGARFSQFHFYSNYLGNSDKLNIPCKGLTAEVYYGWIFWDTETYCIPAYLFMNPGAVRKLLQFRYDRLEQAKSRAAELGCKGARYPFCTIDGNESCGTWQHGDLEIHVGVAVSYAIWLYDKIIGDKDFIHKQGVEMLIEISRYFAGRGEYSPKTGEYGIYGVMGPDEYHMMVNNNCYTNVMAKKTLEYTASVLADMRRNDLGACEAVFAKTNLQETEITDWKIKAEKMRIPYDRDRDIYEQHDGYFDLPEVDVKNIPPEDIPIYNSWPYIKIFRYNMIKQPDFLLLPFFFSQDYAQETKLKNFIYYEERCIHESSLSPGIHSIFAAEFDKMQMAYDFFVYMARLDLDNYNRNAQQGLHVTSMSGCWLNIVNGFAGMRTDAEVLIFNPKIPPKWKSYQFKIVYKGSLVAISIDKENVYFKIESGDPVELKVYGDVVTVDKKGKLFALSKADA
ncbi:MAG: family 65 glycosyl hydrolase [Chitinivibrionales bacterium]|nr:family 65 glycosyl hydrolase [Chitinivibrionales bacterium]